MIRRGAHLHPLDDTVGAYRFEGPLPGPGTYRLFLQFIDTGELSTIAFTVEHGDIADVKGTCQGLIERLGRGEIDVEIGLSKISAVGTGMKSHTGVASRMFRALAEAGIPIHNITTSEIKISCIVDRPRGEDALRVVHDAFGLSSGAGVTSAMQSSGRARR